MAVITSFSTILQTFIASFHSLNLRFQTQRSLAIKIYCYSFCREPAISLCILQFLPSFSLLFFEHRFISIVAWASFNLLLCRKAFFCRKTFSSKDFSHQEDNEHPQLQTFIKIILFTNQHDCSSNFFLFMQLWSLGINGIDLFKQKNYTQFQLWKF